MTPFSPGVLKCGCAGYCCLFGVHITDTYDKGSQLARDNEAGLGFIICLVITTMLVVNQQAMTRAGSHPSEPGPESQSHG